MRLIDVPARKARVLPSQARFLEEELVRGRLPEVRPSALAKRGESALSPLFSLAYEVPDAERTYRTMGERTEFALNHDRPHHWINHASHSAPVLGCHLCDRDARDRLSPLWESSLKRKGQP